MKATLPRNLSALTKILPADEHCRFSGTTCVHLKALEGVYRAEVTDGRRCIIVTGQCDPDGINHGGTADILVPKDTWLGIWSGKDRLDTVEVDVSAVTVNGMGQLKAKCQNRETIMEYIDAKSPNHKFPNIDGVLPRKLPVFTVRVDAKLMLEVLQVAASICGCPIENDKPAVTLAFYGGDSPFAIIGKNYEHNQTFDALVVPLSKPEKATPKGDEEKTPDHADEEGDEDAGESEADAVAEPAETVC